MSPWPRRRFLIAAAVAAPALACRLLAGIGDDQFRVEAPVDASDALAPVSADPCAHAAPPGAPEGGDSPVERTFTFAISRLELAQEADGGAFGGYDLDDTCTCDARDGSAHGGTGSCKAPARAAQPEVCDDDGGVDNAMARTFRQMVDEVQRLPGATPLDLSFDRGMRCGRENILLTLTGYNGEKDDPSVAVLALESAGLRTPHDGGERDDPSCGYEDAGPIADPTYPAKLDGTDVWSYPTGSITEGSDPIPKRSGMAGWVKDFRLVLDGREPRRKLTVPVILGPDVSALTTPVLTARLVPLDEHGRDLEIDRAGKILSPDGKAASFRLTDGALAGRFSAKDLLTVIGRQHLGGSAVCNAKDMYAYLKARVCESVDTASLADNDFGTAPCDALSVGFHLEAVPARFGIAFDGVRADSGCQDFYDSCDP